MLAGMLLSSCTPGTRSTTSRRGRSTVGTHPSAGTQNPLPSRSSGSREEAIPSSLRRPLDLPNVQAGGSCPTSTGRHYKNSLFGGIVLGRGPVLPLLGVARPRDQGPAKQGLLRFRSSPDHPGWFTLKTLWFSFPRYQGPVFIRGRQLDGSQPVGIGEAPSTTDPEFPAGPTVNGGEGFREWPGATWLRTPGCYAWQVDGLDFSYVIVFSAEFED